MSNLILELDDDGYPTDDSLESIVNYDVFEYGVAKLFDGVLEIWSYPHSYKNVYSENGYRVVELSTGGWSGNESVINALKENHMAWLLSWYSSRRGGHHVFKFKEFGK